jgi:hypothetical protein
MASFPLRWTLGGGVIRSCGYDLLYVCVRPALCQQRALPLILRAGISLVDSSPGFRQLQGIEIVREFGWLLGRMCRPLI